MPQTMMYAQNAPPVSVLDPVRHARLVADMDHVCQVANVPRQFIHRSMKEFCGAQEIDWVVNFRVYKDSYAGLVMHGLDNSDTRCMAICAALVRNFIDARVVPLNTVLQSIEDNLPLDPTVLVIPNLQVSSVGKSLPSWKIQQVYDLLLGRFAGGKPTVVSVESLAVLAQTYGSTFQQHLLNHYKIAQ